jgi:hypothetical protein
MDQPRMSYTVNLDFEVIKLPPVTDILVLGKKVPQGKQGILHSFDLILPDTFDLHELDDPAFPQLDAVIINKAILVKMPVQEVVKILKENVFPYVSRGETIKVNFGIHIYQKDIVGELPNENT